MFTNSYGVIFLLVFAWANCHQPIPPQLMQQLKSAQSLNELMSVTTVLYQSPSYGRSVSRYRNDNMPSQVRIQGASLVALPSRRREDTEPVHIDDDTQTNLDILSSIRQGNDTCTLQSICVPVPVDNPDPGVLVFPRCYQITQCVGGCCDSVENCHATAVEYLQKPIVEMVYAGHNRFMINQTRNITMEQHRACSCRDCSLEGPPPECMPGYVIGSSCRCECGNQLDKHDCKGGNKEWNEETCSCECPIRYCRGGGVLNQEHCLCEETHVLLNQPDEGGNYRSDVSQIPRLRSHIRRFP